MRIPLILPFLAALVANAFAIKPTVLRCENRVSPHGIDVAKPRLSWILDSGKQSAYQIVVDGVWDSGKVVSDQSVAVGYAGPALQSQKRYNWRVRVWDVDDKVGEWSPDGRFVTGVLGQPWQGKWIAGQYGSTTQKGIGYHAGETTVDEIKWVQVDLGASRPVDAVVLDSLRHENADGFGYPLRYRIEGADDPDFTTPVLIADRTQQDAPNPGNAAVSHAANTTVRYVRVTATKLYPWSSNFTFALSELQVISGGSNVALKAPVSFKDTVDNYGWHHEALTDGFGSALRNLPVFKRALAIEKEVAEAVLSISGLGHYELFLNGEKVGDDLLAPGWSNYRKTCLYDTFDITDQLNQGNHEFRVMLGNGFFNIPGGRYVKLQTTFGQPMLTMQMRIRFTDGTEQTVLSDESWQTASSPITFSCVFGGEDYDARLEAPLNESSAWSPVAVIDGPGGTLTGLSQAADPIGAIETIKAVSVNKISPNLWVCDFGQNVSFMPRLKVKGVAGASVKMIPAELLAGDGRISDPMCNGNSYYTYTLKGAEDGETWFPQFFYRGGRYLQVELSAPDGMPLPKIQSIESVVVHSKAQPTGDFECSNELFNRIRNLIRWAQRSNLMSVITDCPHREKLGWLEQYHLHGYALRHEWDMAGMYVKGMADMAQAQLENGLVPDIAPEYTVFGGGFRDSPEWGSSFVIVPWQQYEYTGDTSLLETYFDGMKRYCDYLESKSQNLIVSHGLGDWYDIGPNPPGMSQLTPLEVTATAYFFRCADIISRSATLLGKTEDAQRYGTLATQIRAAFNARFWNEETGVFSTGSQCANAIPLVMGIAEPSMRQRALDAIVKDVQAKGLTAGDVGFHYLLRALYEGGRSDVIYAMNNQSDRPGYGYQLKQGATALTEAWNAEVRSSHNHFMLGHITEWLYAGLGGIKPDTTAPGWKKFIIKPAVVGDLTWVKAHYDSPYGRIISHWRKENGKFTLNAIVPANSSATIILPDGSTHQVDPGAHQWTIDLPVPTRTSQILLEDNFNSPNESAAAFHALVAADQQGTLAPRTTLSFDSDWKFLRSDQPGAETAAFDDSSWRTLDVPHDWSIEDLPPKPDAPPELEAVTGEWRFHKGDDPAWNKPDLNDTAWQKVKLPDIWENLGQSTEDNVYGWFRRRIAIPAECKGRDFILLLGRIDDVDEVWLNGERIGGTGSFPPDYRGAYSAERRYRVPAALVRGDGTDLLAVRVFDGANKGGMVSAGIPGGRIGPFDPAEYNATGYTVGGIGWYRKHFTLDAVGKRTAVRFDGIYMNAEIWINGHRLGEHPHGYTSFEFDLTPHLKPPGEENVLAVRVRNEGKNSRWYSGSGIYRHVWLTVREPVHVPTWGVFVTTPEVSRNKALVKVSTEIRNSGDVDAEVLVRANIRNAEGKSVGTVQSKLAIPTSGTRSIEQTVDVASPKLWSPDSPNLYAVDIEIVAAGKVLDSVSTRFGIRKIEADAKNGFRLNGELLLLKGGCIHHDNGPLGAAAIDRAEEHKVELLKANGFNAIRTSHNPPSPALLNACDRLGMLVIDEAFDQWNEQKNDHDHDYHRFFKDWSERDIASMVRRDRNHPQNSVFDLERANVSSKLDSLKS